jgi:hypothetical protein
MYPVYVCRFCLSVHVYRVYVCMQVMCRHKNGNTCAHNTCMERVGRRRHGEQDERERHGEQDALEVKCYSSIVFGLQGMQASLFKGMEASGAATLHRSHTASLLHCIHKPCKLVYAVMDLRSVQCAAGLYGLDGVHWYCDRARKARQTMIGRGQTDHRAHTHHSSTVDCVRQHRVECGVKAGGVSRMRQELCALCASTCVSGVWGKIEA